MKPKLAMKPKPVSGEPESEVLPAEEFTPEIPVVDLPQLMKLRLVVARHGEMDASGWWNSKGLLGRLGAVALQRGFPRTHYFAQARLVFAVARSRCSELFQPPGCMTLWHLPAELEDQFEDRWHDWLDDAGLWKSFFEELAQLQSGDLLDALRHFDLVSIDQMEAAAQLRRSAAGRAVPLPGIHEPGDEVLTLLAAGFCRGEPGKPAIPYVRLES